MEKCLSVVKGPPWERHLLISKRFFNFAVLVLLDKMCLSIVPPIAIPNAVGVRKVSTITTIQKLVKSVFRVVNILTVTI